MVAAVLGTFVVDVVEVAGHVRAPPDGLDGEVVAPETFAEDAAAGAAGDHVAVRQGGPGEAVVVVEGVVAFAADDVANNVCLFSSGR